MGVLVPQRSWSAEEGGGDGLRTGEQAHPIWGADFKKRLMLRGRS